jgi:SAM-dependent methyltransferase
MMRHVRSGVHALAALFTRPHNTPTIASPAMAATSTMLPAMPPSAPAVVYDSLDDYVQAVDAFAGARADLVAIREYNHAMIDALDTCVALAGQTLLDVGASPHGFALERALAKGTATYVGVGLGVWEPAEVRHQGAIGRLVAAYGEALPVEAGSVDLVMSLSTFEHFHDGTSVLREMHRVLRPGGRLFVNFQPVWTSSAGHHLHHIGSVARVIPPWAHLLWTPVSMRQALEGRWPAEAPISLDEAVAWIYESQEINRADIVSLRQMFEAAPFTIEWMVALPDDEDGDKPRIAAYLATLLPYSAEQLQTRGFSILMRRD